MRGGTKLPGLEGDTGLVVYDRTAVSFRPVPEIPRAVGMPWTRSEWSAAPQGGRPRPGRIHPTLFAIGVQDDIIGSRARLAVGDDILDHENTRTAHQRESSMIGFTRASSAGA